MGISFICLGLIGEMESRVNILSVVIIVRFFQGAAASTLVTTYYTICMNDFPERKVEFIGLVSTTVGLGLVCGPILGSALYSVFGYRWTFYTYGGFKIMFAIAMRLNMPERRSVPAVPRASDLDELIPEEKQDEKSNTEKESKVSV